MLLFLIIASVVFALVPALLFRANLRAYAPPPCPPAGQECPPVSVLIPARNEENAIGDAVRAVLRNQGIEFEVVVLDDHSEDRTAAIVEQLVTTDERVRLSHHAAVALRLVRQATRLLGTRPSGTSSLPALHGRRCPACRPMPWPAWPHSSLCLGPTWPAEFPVKRPSSLLEKLLIPLIHFILLGFLPIRWMRRSLQAIVRRGLRPVFIARAQAYHRCGGHSVIRDYPPRWPQTPPRFPHRGPQD